MGGRVLMIEQDKNDFRDVMSVTCELYGKSVSQTMLRLYFGTLQQFTIEQVRQAIGEHISDKKSGSFFPKPADIIRKIEGEDLSPSEEFRQYLRSQGRKVEF